MNAEQIAAGLTAAHGAALFRRFEWQSQVEQEEGERDLWRLGLWHRVRTHHRKPNGKKGWTERVEPTPLGLAVRAIIQSKAGE
jgi:hypothetical protein